MSEPQGHPLDVVVERLKDLEIAWLQLVCQAEAEARKASAKRNKQQSGAK
jgi:hypothetical protein